MSAVDPVAGILGGLDRPVQPRPEFAETLLSRLVEEFEPIKEENSSPIASPSTDGARGRLAAAASGSDARRRRHTRLIVAIAVLLGLLAAVPALSGTGYDFVVHWLAGSPPNEVKEEVSRLDQGAPPGMAQHPIVGKTGLVYDRLTQYGRVQIWLTPNRRGGFCESFEAPNRRGGKTRPMSGGCFPAKMRQPIEPSGSGGGTDLSLGFIEGRVIPSISRLELRYVNGGTDDVPLQGGFFVAAVEKTRSVRLADHPQELIGYDTDGEVVARADAAMFYGDLGGLGIAPPIAETDQEQTLLRVPLEGGSSATLSASPSRAGGECDRISTGDTNWSWTCADSATLQEPIRFSVARPPTAGGANAATLLFGVVRHRLTLTLVYEDGTSETAALKNDRFLIDLSNEHRQPGNRLRSLVVRDGAKALLRVPIATKDDSLYSTVPDRMPQAPMHQIFNPPNLPVVARLKLTGSHGEAIAFFVRSETPTHWYEVLSVSGTVVSGANLQWFRGGHDARIGLEWQPMQRPEFDVPKPLSLLIGHIRKPAVAARVVYQDGSSEPLELARPTETVGHGISGWFVYEMTTARRERKPVRVEALDWVGKVIGSATPPKGA